MIYFTADTHYYHTNIIKYCNRPFKDAAQMNSVIIEKYNQVITNADVVYFLGDFTMEGPDSRRKIERIIQKLKGDKHLILGNHDRFKPFTYIDMGFTSVHTSLEIEGYILTHDPAICQDPTKKYLCGHIHNIFHKLENVLNVGVDVNNFTPISIEEVNKHFK